MIENSFPKDSKERVVPARLQSCLILSREPSLEWYDLTVAKGTAE